jgi:hypothetical protein
MYNIPEVCLFRESGAKPNRWPTYKNGGIHIQTLLRCSGYDYVLGWKQRQEESKTPSMFRVKTNPL